MGKIRDLFGNGHVNGLGNMVSHYDPGYSPCGDECPQHCGTHCTKSQGHTAAQGHRSTRGYHKIFDENGCGHEWLWPRELCITTVVIPAVPLPVSPCSYRRIHRRGATILTAWGFWYGTMKKRGEMSQPTVHCSICGGEHVEYLRDFHDNRENEIIAEIWLCSECHDTFKVIVGRDED